MGKAILIMDMPERCSMCEFLHRTDEDYRYCGRLGFDYQVNEYMMSTPKGKPDWCPLKEIPEKKMVRNFSIGTDDYAQQGYQQGWNACIDEILKERG